MPNYTHIDSYEVEEILNEYYDFSTITTEQWKLIDKFTAKICEERHIPITKQTCSQYDIYCAILDGACAKAGIKKI